MPAVRSCRAMARSLTTQRALTLTLCESRHALRSRLVGRLRARLLLAVCSRWALLLLRRLTGICVLMLLLLL